MFHFLFFSVQLQIIEIQDGILKKTHLVLRVCVRNSDQDAYILEQQEFVLHKIFPVLFTFLSLNGFIPGQPSFTITLHCTHLHLLLTACFSTLMQLDHTWWVWCFLAYGASMFCDSVCPTDCFYGSPSSHWWVYLRQEHLENMQAVH